MTREDRNIISPESRVMPSSARSPFSQFSPFSPYQFAQHQTPSPVLIFHGTADKVIPIRNGRKNYDSAIGRKKFIPVPGADHNDLFDKLQESFWSELENFISADSSRIF